MQPRACALSFAILLAGRAASAGAPESLSTTPAAIAARDEVPLRAEHASVSSIVGGASLIGLGTLAMGMGGFFLKAHRFGPDCWSCSPAKPFGLGVFLGGVASLGVGVPLVVLGARTRPVALADVATTAPRQPVATLLATGPGASLQVHF